MPFPKSAKRIRIRKAKYEQSLSPDFPLAPQTTPGFPQIDNLSLPVNLLTQQKLQICHQSLTRESSDFM